MSRHLVRTVVVLLVAVCQFNAPPAQAGGSGFKLIVEGARGSRTIMLPTRLLDPCGAAAKSGTLMIPEGVTAQSLGESAALDSVVASLRAGGDMPLEVYWALGGDVAGAKQVMRAAYYAHPGDANQVLVGMVPKPVAGPGEVLVRVEAAGLNPVDVSTMAGGGMSSKLDAETPIIVGWDMAGIVEAVGPGVEGFSVGDHVMGMNRFPKAGQTVAQYAVAPAEHLARLQSGTSSVDAAATPMVGLTAWQALIGKGALQNGETVLIIGSGPVAYVAAQIAGRRAAKTIVVGSAKQREAFLEIGVDRYLDYAATPSPYFTLRREGVSVDLTFDMTGEAAQAAALKVMGEGGRIVAIKKPLANDQVPFHLVQPDPLLLDQLGRMLSVGTIQPQVEMIVPFHEAAAAMGLVGGGRKIIVQIPPPPK
jgi:NADPH:quinone reductase-like Zn-dependent oxidoreductase